MDCVDAYPKSRNKEVGDIKDIIKNRMKTLNILEIERKLHHNWSYPNQEIKGAGM